MKKYLISSGLLAVALLFGACKTDSKSVAVAWNGEADDIILHHKSPNVTIKDISVTLADDVVWENVEDRSEKVRRSAKPERIKKFLEKGFSYVFDNSHDRYSKYQLSIEVKEFFVKEDNTYNGTIQAKFSLEASGMPVWSQTITATGKRFGRSLTTDNFNETVSKTLINLINDLTTENQEFLQYL